MSTTHTCHWHVLQPVSVYKSFFLRYVVSIIWPKPKTSYNWLLQLVTQSHTPLNILGGLKKVGIYPVNPGEVRYRCAPSKAKPTPQVLTFSLEQITGFEVWYAECYNLLDTTYLAWKSMYHPSECSNFDIH